MDEGDGGGGGGEEPPKFGNGNIPKVILSEPPSPEHVTGRTVELTDLGERDEVYAAEYDEGDVGSLGVSEAMNNEFDFSTFTLNNAGNVVAEHMPVPPDGGYGWVIVFAAFMSNLIVDGICNCFAVFKESYSTEFQSSDALTALIGSLLIGVYLLVGPFVGGLVNKYGSRTVVIAGSILSGLAFLLSTASPNIFMFMFLYGGLGGAGFGMIYLPAIVVVGYYFESKRALATGLAVAGSGVGTIVMPILAEFCIAQLGWRGAVWIMAVLIFTCCGFGALYRPLESGPVVLDYDEKPKGDELDFKLKDALNRLDDNDSDSRGPSPLSGNTPSRGQSQRNSESAETAATTPGAQQNGDAFSRLRSALSECEGETDTAPSTPAGGAPTKPSLSPIAERVPSKSRAGSTFQPAGAAAANNAPRTRKLTLTRFWFRLMKATSAASQAT